MPTHVHSTRGVDDVILDGQRPVEDRPYHASAHTVNHQGGGRANSITPFVVYCTRGSLVVGAHLSPSLLYVCAPLRARDRVHTFASTSIRRRPYRRAREFRSCGLSRITHVSPISFLSHSLSPLVTRTRVIPHTRFACHREARLRLLLETARVFPWTGYAPSTYCSCQEVLQASFETGDLDKFPAATVILSSISFSRE